MEEKELFYYHKAQYHLAIGMPLKTIYKELNYFIQAQNYPAVKAYKKAISEKTAHNQKVDTWNTLLKIRL